MPPIATPASDRVAFERNGIIHVASLSHPGSALRIGPGQDPTLSPDGKIVAFEEAHSSPSERHLAICSTATGKVLGRRPGVNPKISPDGRWLAYSRFVKGKWTAWISAAGLSSAGAHMLPGAETKDGPAWISHWTSDSNVVAYSDDLGGSLYAIRPTGEVVQRVNIAKIAGSHGTMIPIGIAWSDDRKRLIFEAETGEELHSDDPGPLLGLFLYDFGVGRLRQISPRDLNATGPVWYGPDEIAFSAMKNNGRLKPVNICVMRLSTGAIRVLVPNAGNVAFAGRMTGA